LPQGPLVIVVIIQDKNADLPWLHGSRGRH
jgi:hypothetical protein